MKASRFLLTAVCAMWLSGNLRAGRTNLSTEGIQELWTKPGTEWLVEVKRYSGSWALSSSNPEVNEEAQKPRIACEFHIGITVLEPEGEGEARVARFQFRTLDDAPKYAQGAFVLEIDATTGAPKAVKETAGRIGGNLSIAEFNGERAFLSDTPGFPMCWIVGVADLAQIPPREEDRRVAIETRSSLGPTGHFDQYVKKFRPTVTEPDKRDAVEIEAFSLGPFAEVPSRRVVQTWVPGEGWWRSYTRYIQGHIDLEATLVENKDE